MITRERGHVVILFGVSLIVLFLDASVKELHGTAVFYASLVREVVDSGDYLGIYTDGRAYLLKPPLLVWLSAISCEIFGLTNFGVTFVSRLAGVGSVLLAYFLIRRWWSHSAAWIAAFSMLTNSTFVQFTATLRMDSLLLFGLLLSLTGWAYRHHNWSPAAIFAGITIGVLSKGPLGFAAIPLIFCHAYLLDEPPVRRRDWPWVVLLLPILIWYSGLIGLHGDKPFTELSADTLRSTSAPALDRWQSIYQEYLIKPLRRYWPWLPFIMIGMGLAINRMLRPSPTREVRAHYMWMNIWFASVIIGAALKPDHDIRYLYLALPVAGLYAGIAFSALTRDRLPSWLPVACLAAIGAVSMWPNTAWRAPDNRATIAAISNGLADHNQLVAIGGYPVRLDQPRRQNTHRDWVHFYIGQSPTVYSWDETRTLPASLNAGVFLTNSRGHAQRLDEFQLQNKYATKEMIFAVPE